MTVVLAVKARDGIVLASDSEATSGDESVRTRASARKLDDLHGRIAFGCSGSTGLRQRAVTALRDGLTAEDCQAPFKELRPRLHAIVNPLQQQALQEHVALPGAQPPCLGMLFAAVTGDRAWIYEISEDGKEEEHHPAEAIGGARHHAIHGMVYHAHLALSERPIAHVRVAAYRIVMNTIHADGTGAVALPIQLYEVTAKGARRVPPKELEVIHDAFNALKEQEFDLWVPPVESAPEVAADRVESDGLRLD